MCVIYVCVYFRISYKCISSLVLKYEFLGSICSASTKLDCQLERVFLSKQNWHWTNLSRNSVWSSVEVNHSSLWVSRQKPYIIYQHCILFILSLFCTQLKTCQKTGKQTREWCLTFSFAFRFNHNSTQSQFCVLSRHFGPLLLQSAQTTRHLPALPTLLTHQNSLESSMTASLE